MQNHKVANALKKLRGYARFFETTQYATAAPYLHEELDTLEIELRAEEVID